MKQFQDWVQWELSEEQIDLLQEGNVIAGEDCWYYLGTGIYYKHVRDTNTYQALLPTLERLIDIREKI